MSLCRCQQSPRSRCYWGEMSEVCVDAFMMHSFSLVVRIINREVNVLVYDLVCFNVVREDRQFVEQTEEQVRNE